MPRIFIHRELVVRIQKHGLGGELSGFITAIRDGQHPPRIYKPSGVNPNYPDTKILNCITTICTEMAIHC
jgi:hypothetical protein